MSMPRRLLASVWIAFGLGAAAIAQPGGPPSGSRTYGTKDATLYRLTPGDFVPANDGTAYLSNGSTLVASAVPAVFNAGVHIPSGALLTSFEIVGCDTNPDGLQMRAQLQQCGDMGTACSPVGDVAVDDAAGCKHAIEDLSAGAAVVNDSAHQLFVQLTLEGSGVSLSFRSVLVGYRLQVSPAPATATFGDVPTGYIYFRAIEALAASGIAAGCGSGNYCPDQPVTRGEIAKFLANALGLHWQ